MNNKRGVSLISIILCFVAISLVTAALVVAINNAADYRISSIAKNAVEIIDSSAYIKVYTKNEIDAIARQAFADNYLTYYDGVVDVEGLEALVISDIQEKVPEAQLENYEIIVTQNGVDVI